MQPIAGDYEMAPIGFEERQRVAERHGDPYLLYRDQDGQLLLLSLPGSWEQVNIGRSAASNRE